jgi:alkylhydroperoxidase family enzyme
MAKLPDPTDRLDPDARALAEHIASARAGAEGTDRQSNVYLAMLNNPGVTARVSALGEHVRFDGCLPGDVRELVVLRYSVEQGFGYEWAHHRHIALEEGVHEAVVDAITAGRPVEAEEFGALRDDQRAALEATDAVVDRRSIPSSTQRRLVSAHGEAGIVELVAICGLYALMGYMATAFDVPIEEGLPVPGATPSR